jgi:hypothetical protein
MEVTMIDVQNAVPAAIVIIKVVERQVTLFLRRTRPQARSELSHLHGISSATLAQSVLNRLTAQEKVHEFDPLKLPFYVGIS